MRPQGAEACSWPRRILAFATEMEHSQAGNVSYASMYVVLDRPVMSVHCRLRPRLSTCRGYNARRSGVTTKAGLESDMAVEESSQIPMPKVYLSVLSSDHVCGCQIPIVNTYALQGVTKPRVTPEVAPATFGFVERAERWNSRACMVGVCQMW